jgi:hypothetical protein
MLRAHNPKCHVLIVFTPSVVLSNVTALITLPYVVKAIENFLLKSHCSTKLPDLNRIPKSPV